MRPSVRFLYCPCRWAVPLPGSFRRGELYTGPRAILVRDCEPIERVHVNSRRGLIWCNVKSADEHGQGQGELGIGKASGRQNIFHCASGPRGSGDAYLIPRHCRAPLENVTRYLSRSFPSSDSHLSGLNFLASLPQIDSSK